jgi:HEAT repeat protein
VGRTSRSSSARATAGARGPAARALAELGGRRAVIPLREMLDQAPEEVRREVAGALGALEGG